MTSTQVATLIAVAGCLAFVAGTVLLWGIAVGLMVAGGLAVVTGVVLYDPTDRHPSQ